MTLTTRQFHASEGVEDWRVVGDGVCALFRTGSFAAGAGLVHAIGELTGLEDHAPDVDLRPDGVTVRLVTATDDHYGLTDLDLELARRISVVARELGMRADPAAVQSVLVVIEAVVPAKVMPFWRALLGYAPRADSPEEDLVDPLNRGPAVWFETMQQARPRRNGLHVAVWVPPDEVEARLAAAIAAGGRMVSDAHAPSWWVLADAEGNEADLATTTGRD